jgi:site-specific recombinase XerD
VEGKSLETIQAYKSKLYPFLLYAEHYNLPDDVCSVTTGHIREFLAYLRDNSIRFGGKNTPSRKPVNKTTIQRYYRVLASLWSWLLIEELVLENPLMKIKPPRAEKKIIKGLTPEEVNILLATINNSFDGKRNRAILLILIDCGLRLGELIHLTLGDINVNSQTTS